MMIAAEAVPFVKTGGLADVIGSLPKSLAAMDTQVRVMLPKYEDIPAQWREQCTLVASFKVQVGWRNQYCGLETLTHEGITYYFIDNEFYFKRSGLYGYGDDGERFAFFCQAALESLIRLDWVPDILHAHDWHTALIPVFLKAHYSGHSTLNRVRTVFTIHNLRYQGVFSYNIMSDLLNLGNEHFHANALEYYGNVNYMKGALNYSDFITTVSPRYAKEIQTPYYGEGLDGTLRHRQDQLLGIINGLDYTVYDPMLDRNIRVTYRKSLKKKSQNKLLLQEELGLPVHQTTPVISIISRLVEQKGMDLIARVFDELLQTGAQLIVLGTGESVYEKMFRDAAYHYKDQVSAQIKFDEGMSRRIYAGSDMFLMPSKFEPCGIGQMIAMRYGTVPIVRETGGLADTVQPYNEFTGTGNGFSFNHYNAHDLLYTVKNAIAFYHDEKHWLQLLDNIAKSDFSWNASARKYAALYQRLTIL
jgi:starch synthase